MAAQAVYERQIFASSDESLDSVGSSAYTTATEASLESSGPITPATSMICDSPRRYSSMDLDVDQSSDGNRRHSAEAQRQRENDRIMPSKIDSSSIVLKKLDEEEGITGTVADQDMQPEMDRQATREAQIVAGLREAMAGHIRAGQTSASDAHQFKDATTSTPAPATTADAISSGIPPQAIKTSNSHPIKLVI